MKILMVSSECLPYAKTGGLADVVYSLSKELSHSGHEVKIVIPGYSFLETDKFQNTGIKSTVKLGWEEEKVSFFSANLENSKVTVYFVNSLLFAEREGMYNGYDSGEYRDNHRRFTLLNKSVFPLCESLNWIPGIIHVHDWQASLVPGYLKEKADDEIWRNVKSVLTIHNIAYQGVFSKHDIHVTALPWNIFSHDKARYKDTINFLRSGILNADRITTVSPTYAEEIKTPEFGEGMDKLLTEKNNILKGILNGGDYNEWNPEKDPYLPLHYSSSDMSNKELLKGMLQNECGLEVDREKPLIGMVSRLVSQKGFKALCNENEGALGKICSTGDVQIIILGTGEKWIEDTLVKLSKTCPSLKVFVTFDNTLAHLIEAGADFFLMPSEFEPCGLNQIYSLKYGTIPIVTDTGGLSDSVKGYPENADATGFVIKESSSMEIFKTVREAVNLWYNNRDIIKQLQSRGMSMDFSWGKSAKKYEEIYEELL